MLSWSASTSNATATIDHSPKDSSIQQPVDESVKSAYAFSIPGRSLKLRTEGSTLASTSKHMNSPSSKRYTIQGKADCHSNGFCKVGRAEDFLFGRPKRIHKDAIEDEIANVVLDNGGENRKIVWLYFDSHNDVKWLKEHGCNLFERFTGSVIDDIQQSRISRMIAARLGHSKLGLKNLLSCLGIPNYKRHTAGNDAVFEMQGWLAGLCLTKGQYMKIQAGKMLKPELPKMWEWVRKDVRSRIC